MKYPAVLLPNSQCKCIDAAIPLHHICRATPTKDFIHKTSGKVKDEALFKDDGEFFDYSTNLIGHFQLEHNYISLCGDEIKYFYGDWNFEEAVKVPQLKKDFVIDEGKGYFFFRIGDIHEVIKCPYSKPKNITGDATAYVIHSPSRSNFWHFAIKWKDKNGDFIKKGDTKWKYNLITAIRAALSENIIVATPEIIQLQQNLYCKN